MTTSHVATPQTSVLIFAKRPMMIADAVAMCREFPRLSDVRPVLVLGASTLYEHLPADILALVQVVSVSGQPIGSTRSDAGEVVHGKATAGLKQILSRFGPARAVRLWLKIRSDRQSAQQLLTRHRPGALVMFDDRTLPESIMLVEARAAGIKTMLVPFGISSTDSDAFLRRDNSGHYVDRVPSLWLKRWLAARHENLVSHSRYGSMLFYEPWDALVLAATGLAQGRVWSWGGNLADRVACFGPYWRRRLEDAGVPPASLVDTGQPALDAMHFSVAGRPKIRRDIIERYALDPSRPIVGCTVPHLAEHGISSWDRHWKDTQDLLKACAASGNNVVLSLHPLSKRQDYEEIAAKLGMPILDQPLSEAIVAMDAFVAHYSSTVRWALLLGIPTFIIDQVGFDYDFFDDLPGLTFIKETTSLQETLERFNRDDAFRQNLVSQVHSYSTQCELFDGQSSRRVASVLEELMKNEIPSSVRGA